MNITVRLPKNNATSAHSRMLAARWISSSISVVNSSSARVNERDERREHALRNEHEQPAGRARRRAHRPALGDRSLPSAAADEHADDERDAGSDADRLPRVVANVACPFLRRPRGRASSLLPALRTGARARRARSPPHARGPSGFARPPGRQWRSEAPRRPRARARRSFINRSVEACAHGQPSSNGLLGRQGCCRTRRAEVNAAVSSTVPRARAEPA